MPKAKAAGNCMLLDRRETQRFTGFATSLAATSSSEQPTAKTYYLLKAEPDSRIEKGKDVKVCQLSHDSCRCKADNDS